jgi:hypothetical protein
MGRRPDRSAMNAEMCELKMGGGAEEGSLHQQVVCMMFEGKDGLQKKRRKKMK